MDFDALVLSRLQFAFTVAFHILFPSLTIGLAAFLLVLEVRWIATGNHIYEQLYRFWLKLFALAFGLGVVTGLVLSYEIGTNWGRFSAMTGNVIGPLMGYEVLSAFFLEAGFLGVMIFGIDRVGKDPHLFATAMVTRHPRFHVLDPLRKQLDAHARRLRAVERKFIVMDWWSVIFNPSFPYRLAHRPPPRSCRRRCSSPAYRRGICCATVTPTLRFAVFPWPCGCFSWPLRARFSLATCMV